MRRLFANLLLAAVVLATVSFFAAPGVAFFAIRSAAEAGDVQGLSRLIDFSAVRQSLRPQLTGRPDAMAPAPSFLEDPIGAVRRQFEQNPILRHPDVDAYLTPAALSALTRGEGRYANQWTTTAATDARVDKPWPRPTFWGVNRARFAIPDKGGSRTFFTFERRGPFAWTLVQIGLPDGAAPPAPTSPAQTPRKDTP
ncbi:DUF2939 domain-containing protein [Brevundimonas sp. SORGH_AS_0993]|uniref:DUF2939 domain-containing protein n=1 Tax=Brevundimonas sp. SORGH_AS_0993 TaxID=3041794 RepID=UPI00277E0204|nr:DUF2939 domain-containing protein [Brevundimonas sp. SORGH_AS_0993]MDQ1154940.1 hypothetical protein [Brevundimonas sp. SORGH_AS_0993]